MKHVLTIVTLALGAITSSSLSAQAFLDVSVPGAEGNSVGVDSPAPAIESAAFGHSGAIRAVVVDAGKPVDNAIVAAAGDGWELGHRWKLVHGPWREPGLPETPTPAVLGEPANTAPAEAVSETGTDSSGGVPALPAEDSPAFEQKPIVAPEDQGVWVLESGTGSAITVITQLPASLSRAGILNGYHIGNYPTAGSDRLDAYAPPAAFIEVTPESTSFRISEHLTLGQFLTKDQFEVWPKYVALDLDLVDKLELVIEELNGMGVRAEQIHVMSGFRTPQYNGPGGDGRASLSRHMWGDAADVWIDNDRDGQMDDLNGDGRIDLDDAAVVMRAVERVERKYPELIGGAGSYPTTDAHGPYIHIDARGHRSRW